MKKLEEKYVDKLEELRQYKENKIYCVNGKYMPYLECDYWYDNIDDVKDRVDNPNLVPVTPRLLSGLRDVAHGKLKM